jgi:peptidoglycan/LPS O-acetylase OafA/YrhL
VPVVLYHLDVSSVGGGFVGVDVFFVISGYLITKILANRADPISVLEFYERRIRRILPAMTLVLLFTIAMCYFLYLPTDLKVVGQTIVAASTFSSNVYLWMTSGYFDVASRANPLLHNWSLSVEEQFYIVFPFVIQATQRWTKRGRIRLLTIAMALSFALSIVWPRAERGDAFYLPHYRAWELLVGATLAVLQTRAPAASQMRSAIATTGLVLIVVPMLVYTAETPFPGWAALPPCLGAALVLHAGVRRPDIAALVLTNPWLAYVGKISYSLYLWHWPIIVLYKYSLIRERLSFPDMAWCLSLSIIAAVLSYHIVEQNVRQLRTSRRTAYAFGSVFCVGFFVVGIASHLSMGFPSRFPGVEAKRSVPMLYHEGTCFLRKDQPAEAWHRTACRFLGQGPLGPAAEVFIWGDSHAAHLVPGLLAGKMPAGFEVVQATYAGCPPLVGYTEYDNPHCAGFNDAVVAAITAQMPDYVVLSARWNALKDPITLRRRLETTVEFLKQHAIKVMIIGESPSFAAPVPSILSLLHARGQNLETYRASGSFRADDMLVIIARDLHVEFVSPRAVFCMGQECRITKGSALLFIDESHLSVTGSSMLADTIWGSLLRMQAASAPISVNVMSTSEGR